MKSKSECTCEPTRMHELCMHCDHEKKHKEQRIMYDRIPAQFVESVPGPKQAESNICTKLGKKQGQVKCSSRLGIGSLLLP